MYSIYWKIEFYKHGYWLNYNHNNHIKQFDDFNDYIGLWWPGLWHPTLVALPTSPPYTFRLHPFMHTGFHGAIKRPRPLTSGPLSPLPAGLFTQAPAGLTPVLSSVRSLLKGTTTLSLLWPSYLQQQHSSPGTRSPYSASFFLIALSPYKILSVCLLLVCLSFYTASSMSARTPFIYN